MFKKILLGTLCSIALSACGSENDSSLNSEPSKPLTQAETMQKLEDEGKIPKLERTDSVEGIDNDKNGIRDDIDAYILKNYPIEEQRKAVSQLAKGLQAYLVTDTTESSVVKEVANENARSMACVFSKFEDGIGPNGDIPDEIFAITTNTKKRLLAYYEFDKALDGTVTSSPDEGYCND